jgi:hypothetical protein
MLTLGCVKRWSAGAALLLVASTVFAAPVLPGDVNRDGLVNVRDVQAAINQSLRIEPARAWADLDGNGVVNSEDVRLLRTTVLVARGAVQCVRGTALLPEGSGTAPLRLLALSPHGYRIEVPVSAEGAFLIPLPGGQGWSFAFFYADTAELAGYALFSFDEEAYFTLPVPAIVSGDTVDLGELHLSRREPAICRRQGALLVRDMLIDHPETERMENGLPSFADTFLRPLWIAVQSEAVENADFSIEGLDSDDLDARMAACWNALPDEETALSRRDNDQNGTPDCLDAALRCAETALRAWLLNGEGENQEAPENPKETRDPLQALLDERLAAIPYFLEQLDYPLMVDDDGDGRVDWLQKTAIPVLGPLPALASALEIVEGGDHPRYADPGWLEAHPGYESWPWDSDQDEDGIPDPADWDDDGDTLPDAFEDRDGDGLSALLDSDEKRAWDGDGDGIADALDKDRDNDGTPDYADAHIGPRYWEGPFPTEPLLPYAFHPAE